MGYAAALDDVRGHVLIRELLLQACAFFRLGRGGTAIDVDVSVEADRPGGSVSFYDVDDLDDYAFVVFGVAAFGNQNGAFHY